MTFKYLEIAPPDQPPIPSTRPIVSSKTPIPSFGHHERPTARAELFWAGISAAGMGAAGLVEKTSKFIQEKKIRERDKAYEHLNQLLETRAARIARFGEQSEQVKEIEIKIQKILDSGLIRDKDVKEYNDAKPSTLKERKQRKEWYEEAAREPPVNIVLPVGERPTMMPWIDPIIVEREDEKEEKE